MQVWKSGDGRSAGRLEEDSLLRGQLIPRLHDLPIFHRNRGPSRFPYRFHRLLPGSRISYPDGRCYGRWFRPGFDAVPPLRNRFYDWRCTACLHADHDRKLLCYPPLAQLLEPLPYGADIPCIPNGQDDVVRNPSSQLLVYLEGRRLLPLNPIGVYRVHEIDPVIGGGNLPHDLKRPLEVPVKLENLRPVGGRLNQLPGGY